MMSGVEEGVVFVPNLAGFLPLFEDFLSSYSHFTLKRKFSFEF